jgi:3-hydroxyisobutyrate dehydrogenase
MIFIISVEAIGRFKDSSAGKQVAVARICTWPVEVGHAGDRRVPGAEPFVATRETTNRTRMWCNTSDRNQNTRTRTEQKMSTVAFIGLGNMGIGMAGRVLAAGHELHVYNRTASRAESLVRGGARQYSTPSEACAGADAVIAMVADDLASRTVWTGPSGILSASTVPGAFAVECSTLSHDWVMELAREAKRQGLRYIDAPVTGLPDAAATGELTLLVGASALDLEAARGLLGTISRRILHFGAIGTGTVYKLMINLLGAVQIASAAEGMAIAERAGLDLNIVAEAIATGQAASPQVARNCRRMVDGNDNRDIVFTPQLRLKDVDYALQLTRKLGIGSPFGALAGTAFRQLCELGFQQKNESAIMEVARRQAPK